MTRDNSWWPLSEVSEQERDRILRLPAGQREKALTKLKREIASGAHQRRQRNEAIERRLAACVD